MLGALVFTSIISVVSSSMTFLNGSLAGRSYSSPSVTRFLSPETNTTIEAELIYIDQDGCNARSRVDQSHVHGRAVYLAHPSGCSFEMNYDQFASMGVVALVVMDVYIPGGLGYNMHDGVVQYAHTGMLFVQLGYDEPLLAYLTSRPSGIHIRLSTDPNRWASTYASWPYATFLRWLPALIFTCSGTMAIRYLYGHVMLDLQKRRTTSGGRTPVLYDLVRLPNVALLIKMAEALILAIKFAMCGMLSTPAWPAPAQRYFIQQMSGLTFVTIVISATFWNRILVDLQPTPPSFITRLIIGDFGRFTYITYVLAITSETFFSVAYANYWNVDDSFYKADAGVLAMAQLLVGSQFLFSAIRFRLEANTILEQRHDPNLYAYLHRISAIVIGLGFSCLGYVIGTVMIAVYPGFVTPPGWTLTWSIITISHAIESLLLVNLFRPRSSQNVAGSVVVVQSTRPSSPQIKIKPFRPSQSDRR